MKKALLALTLSCLTLLGCKKKANSSAYVKRTPPPVSQIKPQLPPADQLGPKTTFELTYRGISGKEDDLSVGGGWGFGQARDENPFVKAVRKKAENELYIARNFYLYDREHTPIEFDGKNILYAYFDLNADGQLSDDERLSPATDISEQNRRDDNVTVFMTPDFIVSDGTGYKAPFRVMLWVGFSNNNRLSVTWSPSGMYEGVADLNGQSMRLYLWPNFASRDYTDYGRSQYSLVSTTTDKNEYIPRQTFSSLIAQDNQFYRLVVDEVVTSTQTIKVSLIEDHTARGKIALDIKGEGEFKHKLGYVNLNGDTDETIRLRLRDPLQALPVGDYTISRGSLRYGVEQADEYRSSFQNIPKFLINADETTTLVLGRPQVKVQAVKDSVRYHPNKTYGTEFSTHDSIYIDATFVGIAKESYQGFNQRVQHDNYFSYEEIEARIEIVDSQGQKVVDETLEYG